MNTSHGPLAKIDEAALTRIGRMQGFYTWPTTAILLSYWTFLVGLGLAAVVSRFFMPGSVREVLVITLPGMKNRETTAARPKPTRKVQ